MRFATVHVRFMCGAAVVCALASGSPAYAQLGIGDWVRTDTDGRGMTMTVTSCRKGGFRLTYHVTVGNGQPPLTLTVDLPMDGTEVPTLNGGKPIGQTMAIKRVDERHYTGVIKQNGEVSSTSSATLSVDGKSLTIVDTLVGGKKVTETWVKK